MATRLYFHDAAINQDGIYPNVNLLLGSAGIQTNAPGPFGNRMMNTAIGIGQTSATIPSTGNQNQQAQAARRFITPPLDGNQTVGSGSMHFNCAGEESNTNMNHWWNMLHVVIWNPNNGTVRGTIRSDPGTNVSIGASEPSSANSEQVDDITGIASTSVNALDGDVIIIEIWSVFTQGMSTSYNSKFYYDGITVNTTENAAASNHSSFIEFAETLSFKPPHKIYLIQ
jgi:hypothetical protein